MEEVTTEVLVIGAGPGGYVSAIRAAQLGKKVILIDKDSKLGGVCLNTGCIPTKAMIHASDYYYTLKKAATMGIIIKDYSLDLQKMREWKDGILAKLERGIAGLCKSNGITVIHGTAKFESQTKVLVEGTPDISSITFQNCIIATGSSSIEIPGFHYDKRIILSSEEALELHEIPKSIVIIGGGYIGTELGTVFGKLGSYVSIIEATENLIPVIEHDLVQPVTNKLSEFNVKIYFSSKAVSYEEKDGKAIVKIQDKDGKEQYLEGDKVLVVVGRKPNTKEVGLEKAGIALNEKGFIKVDKQMKTNVPGIFAIGDVVGQPMLAHKASREGKIAAEVICGMNSEFDNKVIPFVVFNDPEIASVGLTEAQAKEKGFDVIIGKFPFSALGRALTLNKTDGFVKYVAEKDTGLILGVHAVGPSTSDIISEATLAIEMGAKLEDIASTIHPHPTLPESLMEAAEVTMGKAIHIFSPKK